MVVVVAAVVEKLLVPLGRLLGIVPCLCSHLLLPGLRCMIGLRLLSLVPGSVQFVLVSLFSVPLPLSSAVRKFWWSPLVRLA